MVNTTNNSPMSTSEEISLLTKANKLEQFLTSKGFKQPLRLLMYHCVPDMTPLGLELLGFEVHAVNSDPTNTQQLSRFIDTQSTLITCDSYPIFEMSEHENQPFDVVLIDGLIMTELRTDSQLDDVCQQLATIIRPDGLLVITTADFDETLQVKERILPPRIIEDNSGRHLHTVIRDWHGSGYEYTETHYIIDDSDGSPTVTHQRSQRRAWRNVELTLALSRAGFDDVLWQSDEQYTRIMTARKQNQNRSQ